MLNVVETIKRSNTINYEKGIQEGVVAYLVMRLGRPLTSKEQDRVREAIHTPEDAGRLYLLSGPEELEAWLTPKAKPSKKKP